MHRAIAELCLFIAKRDPFAEVPIVHITILGIGGLCRSTAAVTIEEEKYVVQNIHNLEKLDQINL